MRLVAAALLVSAGLVAAADVAAASEECERNKLGGVDCSIRRDDTTSGSSTGGSRPRVDPGDVLYWPDLVLDAQVGFCVTVRREVFPGAAGSRRAMEAEQRMLRMFATYDLCPGVQRPPKGPRTVAREVIESFLPPPPQPEIDPGFAITGKPAYLETKGNLRPPQETRPTPLGAITVTFTGTYLIDWGDGTPQQRFDTEGKPWPDGTITHTFVTAATRTVTVTIEWRADWSIGPINDRIVTGLQSQSRIDNFAVRELQAVRDR